MAADWLVVGDAPELSLRPIDEASPDRAHELSVVLQVRRPGETQVERLELLMTPAGASSLHRALAAWFGEPIG